MFEKLNIKEKGCTDESLLSDRFHIQKLLLDFDREASIHLDDDNTKKLLIHFSKIYSESIIPLTAVTVNEDLLRTWSLFDIYLKLERCGGCIEHFILAFQMISSILTTNPNSVYLLFTPLNERTDICPIKYICLMLSKSFYGLDPNSPDFENLLYSISFLQTDYVGNDIKDEFIRGLENIEKENLKAIGNCGSENKKFKLEELVVNLITDSLDLFELILKYIDDLTFMYEADFRQTENFIICIKTLIDTYSPIFQAILSSKMMLKLHGKETDKIKETRIIVLRIFERLTLVLSNTGLLPYFLESLNREIVGKRGTVFESLMDILSPDFPNWYTFKYQGLKESKNFIFSLQLQFTGFLFLKTICNSVEESYSAVDMFLNLRKHHIPFDELPDFISQSNYWFSDIKDKLNFDQENSVFGNFSEYGNSLPQYVNSIFSNLFYRVAAVAFHNGLKLQQNMIDFSQITETFHESIIGSETLALKRLYSLKIDLFIINIQIIAFTISSIVSISDDIISDYEFIKSNPTAEIISILHLFLVWICEFVFEYKSKIPQFYHILEEINMIKIRLPILHNAFNNKETTC
ncbi:2 transmembrane domains [Cryptosporidium sp. chipmunk genotype I]|uniref:2 transmembrane domains n=1 Tax=Cryptosporidium sp. chipmunk genotype I TaxID=1280935 RepID=UPI00351A169D|nr:2 transmembrane domains [Cryptosporidium sp. chipmunk genotype I]